MSGYAPTAIYGIGYHGSTLPPGSPGLGTEMDIGGASEPYTGTGRARLVLAGANIAAGDALTYTATDTVQPTSATSSICVGVNDLSGFGPNQAAGGVAVASGEYFWMNVGGPCQVKMAASIAIGDPITPSAVAGTLGAYTPGGTATVLQNSNIVATADSGAGGVTKARQF